MDILMDKKKILIGLIALLNDEISVAKASLDISHSAAIDAEGAMMSRYDTTKEESQYLTDANMVRLKQLESGLQAVKSMENKVGKKESVMLGCLVDVEKDGERSLYFVMPYGGGNLVKIDGYEFFVLTPSSPLGRQLIGKKEGDMFEFILGGKKNIIKVMNVQ